LIIEPQRKAELLARSHFSYEKRRKELEKKKKKEAKRLAKAERKAAKAAGEETPEPAVVTDEFGNVIEVEPVGDASEDTAATEPTDSDEE